MAERTAELQHARAELTAKNAALVELAHRKEQLSALIVHDIKGPATAMMLRARERMGRATSDADRRAWAVVYANGGGLARLATNLLDVARSEEGSFTVERERVELDVLASDVGETMQPLADARDQRLVVAAQSGAEVAADPEVLARVLQNLIENAIAHNPRGGTVRIEASVGSDAVVLVVSDEGPGVPADQRERIFEKYVRLTDGAAASHTGRGLGLAFCRLAVEEHGGRIWVDDASPCGSRFNVRLPAAEAELRREARGSSRLAQACIRAAGGARAKPRPAP